MSTSTDAVTATASAAGSSREEVRRVEVGIALLLFIFACVQLFLIAVAGDRPERAWSAVCLGALLAGGYLGLNVRDARDWLHETLARPFLRMIVGPAVLVAAAVVYAYVEGLTVPPRAAAYSAYLLVPGAVLVFGARARDAAPPAAFVAAVMVWLPIEFDLLPALPLPAPGGYDASRLMAIVGAFYLFLVARPLDGIGYTFHITGRDALLAAGAVAAYAVVALPLGLATGFLAWSPRIDAAGLLVMPVEIYLITAVPEEFLFRGVMQNLLTRWWGPRMGLAAAAIIFGLAHLPDLRYAWLATVAGVAYGTVYARTGKIAASALTHTGVNWMWGLLLPA